MRGRGGLLVIVAENCSLVTGVRTPNERKDKTVTVTLQSKETVSVIVASEVTKLPLRALTSFASPVNRRRFGQSLTTQTIAS